MTRRLILIIFAALTLATPSAMANPVRTVHTLWVAPVVGERINQSGCQSRDSMTNKALELQAAGNYADAERLLRQALLTAEVDAGLNAQGVVDSLLNLARVLCLEGKFAEAQRLYERAVAVSQQNAALQAWQVGRD